MRMTSIIVLAVAVLLGLAAVLGVRGMLNANRAAPTIAGDSNTIATTVVVARQPLEFGSELQTDLLKEIPWASTELPEGSFATLDEILSGERRVALRSIAPGELILRDRISGFGGRATLSQIIEPGRRAVTLRVNDVSGAGGFVLPGDRVDVLFTSQPGDEMLDTVTNVLLEDVRVLAIDQMADDAQEGAVVAKAATLEVAPADGQRIALASTIGSLSLSLRNISSINDDDTLLVNADLHRTISYKDLSLDTGIVETVVDDKGTSRPVRRAPRVKRAAPTTTTMRVLKGTEASDVEVLLDPNSAKASKGAPAELLGGQSSRSSAPPPAQ